MILEDQHEKLKAVVTKRKAILSGKRQIVNGKHVVTTAEVHGPIVAWEKNVKKRKISRTERSEREASDDGQESIDESEAIHEERLPILDCIEVRKKN